MEFSVVLWACAGYLVICGLSVRQLSLERLVWFGFFRKFLWFWIICWWVSFSNVCGALLSGCLLVCWLGVVWFGFLNECGLVRWVSVILCGLLSWFDLVCRGCGGLFVEWVWFGLVCWVGSDLIWFVEWVGFGLLRGCCLVCWVAVVLFVEWVLFGLLSEFGLV